jgi:hypothetical protein
MKLPAQHFLKLRPILVGAALCNLMWAVMMELRLREEYVLGDPVLPELYYDKIIVCFLLLTASVLLLLNRKWCHGIAFAVSLLIFSGPRAHLWWQTTLEGSYRLGLKLWWFFKGDDFLIFTLSASILTYSALSLFRSLINRKSAASR